MPRRALHRRRPAFALSISAYVAMEQLMNETKMIDSHGPRMRSRAILLRSAEAER